jgi:hypothetical protein
VVPCTMADPWRADLQIDPTDRDPESASLVGMARENTSLVGLVCALTIRHEHISCIHKMSWHFILGQWAQTTVFRLDTALCGLGCPSGVMTMQRLTR